MNLTFLAVYLQNGLDFNTQIISEMRVKETKSLYVTISKSLGS